ncbi:hypothetical protein [Methanimicrococcus blatticola]|uniref:Uncharacterized protein n=1 Tax=Methanimicrococcus blatticola TaxID=91560 RepID=A0A484F2P0_9EURY|nr:hypothetical protein [Methanimicrococcus blatticola]MBZ3935308.1 hypothetical protein [Methanimicrococcus blatticola]TDQ67901.1 hypothetical protein C7391_1455 [Methanimicrococcus blatticola]
MAKKDDMEEIIADIDDDDTPTAYTEIKMGGGWYMAISLERSERFDKEYVEISKERAGKKRARFNLSPKHTRVLGEALIRFADENDLDNFVSKSSSKEDDE